MPACLVCDQASGHTALLRNCNRLLRRASLDISWCAAYGPRVQASIMIDAVAGHAPSCSLAPGRGMWRLARSCRAAALAAAREHALARAPAAAPCCAAALPERGWGAAPSTSGRSWDRQRLHAAAVEVAPAAAEKAVTAARAIELPTSEECEELLRIRHSVRAPPASCRRARKTPCSVRAVARAAEQVLRALPCYTGRCGLHCGVVGQGLKEVSPSWATSLLCARAA